MRAGWQRKAKDRTYFGEISAKRDEIVAKKRSEMIELGWDED